MSDYLSNLAATVVHPGSSVRPRLPGRFEPLHLVSTGPFDFMASNDTELTSTIDAVHDEPAPPAKPDHSSGDLTPLSADAPTRVDRPGDRPALATSLSPPLAGSEPWPSQSRPPETEVARPEAEPGELEVSEGALLAVQPTTAPPALETGKRQTTPDKAGPVSPVPMPDTFPASTDSGEVRPSKERRPVPPLSHELRPIRLQPPAVPPEARPKSAPEQPAPVRPAALDSDPFAQGSTPHIAASGESHRQIEPAAPPAGAEPASSQAAQRPPAKPGLGRRDGRAVVEPHFMEPIADLPLHQARASKAPTIRVTIGRIEVRAAMSPDPPRRLQPVRRQPALSLDQYLQRRTEGKR